MEDKPYAFSVYDWERSSTVYPSVEKAIADNKGYLPQQLQIIAHHENKEDEHLDLPYFLLHGFAVEKNVDGEMVAKIVDKQIEEREKWIASLKEGRTITGCAGIFEPMTPEGRSKMIEFEIERLKYDWKNVD